MRLYVCSKDNAKIYLNLIAETRQDLAQRIGGFYFTTNDGSKYNVNQVYAETTSSDTAAGTVIGGVVGLIGGVLGVLVGATIGRFIGNNSEQDDKAKVRIFNSTFVENQPFNNWQFNRYL